MQEFEKNYMMKKIIVSEKQKAFLLNEDFPSSWNWADFKMLTSFAARKKYCETHLTRLKQGSSRITYKVDNETVLKLAFNAKGIAQNEVEADYSLHDWYSNVLTNINADLQDLNDRYVVAEFAHNINNSFWQNYFGFPFEYWVDYLKKYKYQENPSKYKGFDKNMDNIPFEFREIIRNDTESFFYQVIDMCNNFSFRETIEDFCRIGSYGYVVRDNEKHIVIRDYGFNEQVYEDFYKRK